MLELRPYQIEGVKFLKARNAALLADEPGIGKTIQAIEAVRGLVCGLIIVPASLRYQWLDQIEEHLGYYTELVEGHLYKLDDYPQIVICSYDIAAGTTQTVHKGDRVIKRKVDKVFQQFKKQQWDFLICDESHYMKTPKVKRTRKIIGKGGLHMVADRVYLLTGTPILNRPKDLYPVIRAFLSHKLDPMCRDLRGFEARYCGGHFNRQGFWEALGATNIPELQNILKGFMLRRLAKDVLPELPGKKTQVIVLPPTGAMKSIMALEKTLTGHEREHYGTLGELATLRKNTAQAKLPSIIEYAKLLLDSREKVLIFAYHREVVEELARAFKCPKIYGGMTDKAKHNSKLTFINDPKCRVLIGQIVSAGQGIDGFQKVCYTVLFAEGTWVSEELEQDIKRLDRWGQKHIVDVRYMVIKGSIEEQMLKTVIRKARVIDSIVGKSDKEII